MIGPNVSVPLHEPEPAEQALRRALSGERRWSRWKWLGLWRATRHQKRAARATASERIVHGVLVLRSTIEPIKGHVILIACTCGACYWRMNGIVKDEHLVGDWAKPFRAQVGVPARGKEPKS